MLNLSTTEVTTQWITTTQHSTTDTTQQITTHCNTTTQGIATQHIPLQHSKTGNQNHALMPNKPVEVTLSLTKNSMEKISQGVRNKP